MRILIVEDDATLADGLSVGLRLSGFTPELVETCADANEAMSQGGIRRCRAGYHVARPFRA